MTCWPSIEAVLLTLAAVGGIGALIWARSIREELDEHDEAERRHDEAMSLWKGDL